VDPPLPGTLYVVATPIGNLGDVSERARAVLADVAAVVAEDTRRTGRLLAHLDVSVPLISNHEHNEASRVPRLLARLAAGEDLALVSDAGTPTISDPGYPLVRAAVEEGVPVVPIPGPCAAVAALTASGLPTDRFLFAGFPPRSKGKRRRWLAELAGERGTLVLYEAPPRLARTCQELAETLGDRQAVLARELTKLHEEFVRGTLHDLAGRYGERAPRGEVVLVVAGAGRRPGRKDR